MNIRVIIFGASGMVGEGVLLTALADERVQSVLVIGRRTCGVAHPKLREILHADISDLRPLEEQLRGYDACYFCLGVSSVGMKEDAYTRVTYDLTMSVATLLARVNPGMTFCYVSGQATDGTEQGRLMWARVKGRTENHLSALPFRAVHHFRPGLMKPVPGQHNVKLLFRIVASPYPLLHAIFPKSVCRLADLGRSMINVTLYGSEKRVLENPDITQLAAHPHTNEST